MLWSSHPLELIICMTQSEPPYAFLLGPWEDKLRIFWSCPHPRDGSLPISLLNGEPEHSEFMRGREGVSDLGLDGGGFLDPDMPLNVRLLTSEAWIIPWNSLHFCHMTVLWQKLTELENVFSLFTMHIYLLGYRFLALGWNYSHWTIGYFLGVQVVN